MQVQWSGHSNLTLALIEKFEHFAPTGDRGCKNISLMFESPGETLTIFKLLSLLLKRINYFFENAKTPSNSLSLGKMWISIRKIWNDFMQRETFLKIDMSVTCLVNVLKKIWVASWIVWSFGDRNPKTNSQIKMQPNAIIGSLEGGKDVVQNENLKTNYFVGNFR